MGHVPGKGLGKNLQGIATPIEAVQRKGRGAIGIYGAEKKVQPFQDEQQEDEEGEFKHKLRRWKKGEVVFYRIILLYFHLFYCNTLCYMMCSGAES